MDIKEYETRRNALIANIADAAKAENMPLALAKGRELNRLEADYRDVINRQKRMDMQKSIEDSITNKLSIAFISFATELIRVVEDKGRDRADLGNRLHDVFEQEFNLFLHRIKFNGTLEDILKDIGYAKAPMDEEEHEHEAQEPVGGEGVVCSQSYAKAVIYCLGEQNLFGFVRSVEDDGRYLLCSSVNKAMRFKDEGSAMEAVGRIVGNERKHKCNLWKKFNILIPVGTEVVYEKIED